MMGALLLYFLMANLFLDPTIEGRFLIPMLPFSMIVITALLHAWWPLPGQNALRENRVLIVCILIAVCNLAGQPDLINKQPILLRKLGTSSAQKMDKNDRVLLSPSFL